MLPSAARQHAHELLDRMPPNQVVVIVDLLEVMLDPVSRALANAPPDDEPAAPLPSVPEEDGMSHEAFLAEFGLTPLDVNAVDEFKLEQRS